MFRLCECTQDSSCLSSMESVLSLQGHTSAVKSLSSSHSKNKLLLFSGGARASLKVWSFEESTITGCYFRVHFISNISLLSLMFTGRQEC